MSHYDTCGAPICRELGGDGWYPEEEICSIRSSRWTKWQRNQHRIQDLFKAGKLKHPDEYFTKEMLTKMSFPRPGRRGRKSEDGPMFASELQNS